MNPSNSATVPAIVVGLCQHGLATARALTAGGVHVHALEANPRLPGTRSRYANLHLTADINGPPLIAALRDLANNLGTERPVLYLMNDNMVREVAGAAREIGHAYRLSWADGAETVRSLAMKDALADHCRARGLRYPEARVARTEEELTRFSAALSFPIIVKPIKPLSGFKVRLVRSPVEMAALAERHHSDLPFLLQRWIAGGDEQLYFCALYLDRGRVLARFDGRKLRSHPKALGATSVARAWSDEEVYRHSLRFFEGLELSGPVSLELKRDRDGRLWVIEPTVGRTDFWLACCIANGVDLPMIEFCHQIGAPLPAHSQLDRAVWYDTENDAGAFIGIGLGRGFAFRKRSAFPYLHRRDFRPSLLAARAFIIDAAYALSRRLRRLVNGRVGDDKKLPAA